jgi:hypothetical protein
MRMQIFYRYKEGHIRVALQGGQVNTSVTRQVQGKQKRNLKYQVMTFDKLLKMQRRIKNRLRDLKWQI